MPISFSFLHADGAARAGLLRTDHGEVPTPIFMPVGTQSTVKGLTPAMLHDIQARIILANTYHLVLRPGSEIIDAAGGLHRFMGWSGPILTDSGGFQVFSLSDLRKIEDHGITFRSHIDGSLYAFTPERAIEEQAALGADIIMSFDYCTDYPCSREEAERAVRLTSDWAKRGAKVFGTAFERNGYERWLFGIVQGSVYNELRKRSREALLEIDFPGYAIGALSVGEKTAETWDVCEFTASGLPEGKPRYLMGLGTPLDLVNGIERGIDMFDCVMPTRNARNGTVFTRFGKINLRNAAFARDFSPLDPDCKCYTCREFSRAYLRHLFQAGEMLGPTLATLHSLCFYLELMRDARDAILGNRFGAWRDGFVDTYTSGTADGARSM